MPPHESTAESNHAEIVTLRDLLDERTTAFQAAIESSRLLDNERHVAIEAKLKASDRVLEHRLQGLNELRGDVITKGEFKAEIVGVSSEIAALREWKAEQQGKASAMSVIGAYVVAIFSLLLGIAAVIIQTAR